MVKALQEADPDPGSPIPALHKAGTLEPYRSPEERARESGRPGFGTWGEREASGGWQEREMGRERLFLHFQEGGDLSHALSFPPPHPNTPHTTHTHTHTAGGSKRDGAGESEIILGSNPINYQFMNFMRVSDPYRTSIFSFVK